jgi:hypothetical protein
LVALLAKVLASSRLGAEASHLLRRRAPACAR